MDWSLVVLILCGALALSAVFAMCGLPMARGNPFTGFLLWLDVRLREIEVEHRAKKRR